MTRPANAIRGETELVLGGERYTLRPSFENLVAAEEELGSLFALVERASQGSLTMREIETLLWHCLHAEPSIPREAIGAGLLEIGLVAATKPVRTILAQVLQGRS